MGFQNYNIFSIMIGSDIGIAVPTLNPNDISSLESQIQDNGDVYAGLGTGGVAGQIGINTSSFLVKNLYLSLKFGIFKYDQGATASGSTANVSYQQFLLGLGVNYRWIHPWDFGLGLLNWRGVSLGTGLTYNANNVTVQLGYPDYTVPSSQATTTITYQGKSDTVTVAPTISNIQGTLKIDSTALTIPIEADTSVQLLYLLNLGLALGADINLPASSLQVSGGASSNVKPSDTLALLNGVTATPGNVSIVATDSKNNPGFWDIVTPRISTDVGLNLLTFRIDVPMSFYPITRTFVIGISGGLSY